MDILAHALWTNITFFKKYKTEKKSRWWAVFFGIFPDLVSFSPVFLFYLLFKLTEIAWIGGLRDWFWHNYSAQSYNYSHSLVTFGLVFLVALVIRRGRAYWPLLGWALHIMLDIFTHPSFYQTPFLFPLSNFKNHYAISWADPRFMLVNYGSMAIVYGLVYFFQKKKAAKK